LIPKLQFLFVSIYEEHEGNLPQTDHASAFVVDRVKIFHTSSLITEKTLVAVSRTVRAHVGGPKNGDAESPPLGMWGVADL